MRREPKRGDVSPRDRDRHAFLEVLLGARDALYLSYVAVEAKSGQALAPSSVVLELADALAPYLGAPIEPRGARRRSPRGIRCTAGRRRRAASRGRCASAGPCACAMRCARTCAAVAMPIPDEDGLLALLDCAAGAARGARARRSAAGGRPPVLARPVSLANVRAFLESPIQAWAQAVLGLDELPDDEVDRAQRRAVRRRASRRARSCCARCSRRSSREPGAESRRSTTPWSSDLELRGQFPVGVFGEPPRERKSPAHRSTRWREELGPVRGRRAPPGSAFGRAIVAGAELVAPRSSSMLAAGPAACGSSARPSCSCVDGDRHTSVIPLSASARTEAPPSPARRARSPRARRRRASRPPATRHVLLDPEGRRCESSHDPWPQDEARAYLAGLVRELLDEPHGYLLPFENLVQGARAARSGRSSASHAARLRADRAHRRPRAPPDDAIAIADRRLRPLVAAHARRLHDRRVKVTADVSSRDRASARPASRAAADASGSSSSRRRPAPARRSSSSIASSISSSRGADLAQILLVTFTDKAVAELRMRIRDLLDRLSRATVSPDARDRQRRRAGRSTTTRGARLRAAVTAFDHAPIFTIHGFCHRVLIEDAFAARRLFDQTQVADEVAFDAAFGRCCASGSRAVRRIASCSARTSRPARPSTSCATCCSGVRAPMRRRAARSTPPRVRAIAGAPRASVRHAGRSATALIARLNWKGQQIARAGLAAKRSRRRSTAATAPPIARSRAARAMIKTAPACCRRCSRRRDASARRALLDAVDDDVARRGDRRPAAAARSLERIGADKAEHGLFDYDDMLELVWRGAARRRAAPSSRRGCARACRG